MIYPRVSFIGDPAAAAPYVGIAKKLARECFYLKISSKIYNIGSGIQIKVENIFSINEPLKGISKVLIQTEPGGLLLFSIYPKNGDNPYGWDIDNNPMISAYQVGLSTQYLLYVLYAQSSYKKKNLHSLNQVSNQFYFSVDRKNISFYPGPQSDCPVLVYYAQATGDDEYKFSNEILKRIYEPFILFTGATPPNGFPAAISQNVIASYPLQNSYNLGYISIGSLYYYLVLFSTGRNISLGCFKEGNTLYRIEAVPSSGIMTSYITVYFKYYIGNDNIQTITLRTLEYSASDNPDLFPYKFNSIGTKFAHVVLNVIDSKTKYQVIEYSIDFDSEGAIILTNSVIDESNYVYSSSGTSSGNGSDGDASIISTTTGTSPFSVYYNNNDELKIVSINLSIVNNITVTYRTTYTETDYVYAYGQLKSYNYTGNTSYDETNTTTTKINIITELNNYSVSDYTDTTIKQTDHDVSGHVAYFEEDKYYSIFHYESITTQRDGYSGTLLESDAKNDNFFISAYGLSSSNVVSSQREQTSYSQWIYPPGYYSAPVETLTRYSSTSKTQSHQCIIRNNNTNLHNSTVNFYYNSSNSIYTDLVNEECPTNSSSSDYYEISAPIMHGISNHLLNKDTYTQVGISYAGVNIESGYHYIANIVGICPNSFASGINPVANGFSNINLIISSINNLQSKFSSTDMTIYPISIYYPEYESLLPTPNE